MSKKKPTPSDEIAGSFEESLGELERIVAELESARASSRRSTCCT